MLTHKGLLCILLLVFPAVTYSQLHVVGSETIPVHLDVQYAIIPHDAVTDFESDALNWENYDTQAALGTANKDDLNGWKKVLLKSSFVITDYLPDSTYYMVLPPINGIVKMYINGHLFVKVGTDYPYISDYELSTAYYMIPRPILNPVGEPNDVYVEVRTMRSVSKCFSDMIICTLTQATRLCNWLNFLNIVIAKATMIFGSFIFFLFFFLFVAKRNMRYFYFMLIAIASALSSMYYAYSVNGSHSMHMANIAGISFCLNLVALLLFFINYYNMLDKFKHKQLTSAIIASPIIILIIILIIIGDIEMLRLWSKHIAQFFIVPALGVLSLLSARFVYKSRTTGNFLMLSVLLSVFIGVLLDSIGFRTPYINFTPVCLFIFLVMLLFLFINDFKDVQRELENKTIAIQKQNTRMEDIIRRRTSELRKTNEDLLSVNDNLQEANILKDKFISIIAHDIRNPLGGIINVMEILKDEDDVVTEEEKREFLDLVHKDSKNLFKLLQNILEWSHAKNGKMEYKPRDIDIKTLVNEVVDLSIAHASVKLITVSSVIEEGLTTVYADDNMLNCILRNLLGNAIKFSPAGKSIEMLVMSGKPANNSEAGSIIFKVVDHGVGMSREKVDSLFKIDKIESTPGTSQEQGTGLGLLLCHELVIRHKGTIAVNSTPNVGTTFTVTLPQPEK